MRVTGTLTDPVRRSASAHRTLSGSNSERGFAIRPFRRLRSQMRRVLALRVVRERPCETPK